MKEQGSAAGAFYLLFLLLSAFFGSVFMMGPMLPLMFLHPSLYRQVNDVFMALYLSLPVALLELIHKVKFITSGDRIRPNERCVIIMNHRTRLDWMMFWPCLFRQSSLRCEKIILKAGLKNIPGPGWAMQVAGFIFLTRNWQKDEAVLKEALDYYHQLKYTPQILLFPEGTDYCKVSKPASDRYAKKNDLQIYDYVLHPRTTGFNYIVQHLINCEMIDAVYDVNIGYPEGIPVNGEGDLLRGRFPGEVHTKIRRYPISSLPAATDTDIQEWCLQRWKEKEETLRKFYEDDREFINDTCIDSPGGDTHHDENTCKQHSNHILLYLSIIYWSVFLLVSLYFLYAYSLARWFFLVVCIFYAVQGLLRGGIDHLIVSCSKN